MYSSVTPCTVMLPHAQEKLTWRHSYQECLERVCALTATACSERTAEGYSAQQPQSVSAQQYQNLLADTESEASKHERWI